MSLPSTIASSDPLVDWDSDASLDGIPVLELLSNISEMDENIRFRQNGYEKIAVICDTLQGKLYKAKKLRMCGAGKESYVAIKKTSKELIRAKIAIEGDINFCVSENIIIEAQILKYLTVDHQPIGDYIAKYVDFFESDDDYYLVTEYIASEMNLKEFVWKANGYINNGRLSMKEYQSIMKYLLFQLFVTVQWLHDCMHCCHLDLCTENIMLLNGAFIHEQQGRVVHINPKISVKLVDFGVAEVFELNSFLCSKQGLSLENEAYFAPKVFCGEVYDARGADIWRLGMIMFEVMTVGKHLYQPLEIYEAGSGYDALFHNKLREYLMMHKYNMLKYFNFASFSLLKSLLNINETHRLMNVICHPWFKVYFKRYKIQISKKFAQRKQPFYNIL